MQQQFQQERGRTHSDNICPFVFALLVTLSAFPCAAVDVALDLAYRFSLGDVSSRVMDVAVDPSGNLFMTGTFTGTVDVDPGFGVFNLTSAGQIDAFVMKLTPGGQLAWAFALGGTRSDEGSHIAIDPNGNVLVTGEYMGSVDFDPGPGTEILSGGKIFIAKYTHDGVLLWAGAVGANASQNSDGIDTDAAGNIYVSGIFWDTGDFDPGPQGTILLPVGNSDMFVLKLDPDGEFEWAWAIGGEGYDDVRDIDVDDTGNVHIVGIFSYTTDFDPGDGVFELVAQQPENDPIDSFFAKYNTDGQFQWAGALLLQSSSNVRGVAADANGNVYVTWPDNFVRKMNAQGALQWVRGIHRSDPERWSRNLVQDIAVDEVGNVYMTGGQDHVISDDFDPGPDTFALDNPGLEQFGFVWKLTSEGDFAWVRGLGGDSRITTRSISIAPNGGIYAWGHFEETADFDPGPDTFLIWNATPYDTYLVKFSEFIPESVWVDFCTEKTPFGWETFPFKTLQQGLNAVEDGGAIHLYTGVSGETATISMPVTLRAVNGPVRIGVSAR